MHIEVRWVYALNIKLQLANHCDCLYPSATRGDIRCILKDDLGSCAFGFQLAAFP